MAYRDTASFGKRQEYVVIAELLKRGFDVYMTLVDDQGIDCIIRINDKKYIDIQIKARSKTAKQGSVFAAMTVNPRNNFYWIFYTEIDNNYWIIPSKDLVKLCQINKLGKNVGKMHLSLPKSGLGSKALKYEKYKNDNGFKLLNSK
ncbi:MAG: hypothetical protein GF365_00845 [Candidatus Buchananbacteria bacterium]|nr:hypothetical protein [Candidatus Buchananbacteria bacterium]